MIVTLNILVSTSCLPPQQTDSLCSCNYSNAPPLKNDIKYYTHYTPIYYPAPNRIDRILACAPIAQSMAAKMQFCQHATSIFFNDLYQASWLCA